MSIHTGVDPRLLQQLGDDITQLVQPIHVAIRRQVVTHPPLLDQLRAATQPSSTAADGPERHAVPQSRPPLSIYALDVLATIYVELSGWHARHRLPTPPTNTDWHKAVLRQLVGLAPTLADDVADWLATDVHEWWHLAATTTGWTPSDLRKLR